MSNVIRIGTRESKLAVAQAQIVAASITGRNPKVQVQFVTVKTTGDKILDRTLDKVGGKGLFVKELDEALLRGDADICVHSYKDMPADENAALPVIATSWREDPRDVLILPPHTDQLNPQLPIGCSSQRRQVQLSCLYPGQPIAPVRGNILTRLEKLDRGEYGALVLAYAGIKRLHLDKRVSRVFSPEELLPAGCQGILAVQGRQGEDHSYLTDLQDQDAWDVSTAERAFVRTLNCGCGAPVGVYGKICEDTIWLRAMVADAEKTPYYGELTGSRLRAAELGIELAEQLAGRCTYAASKG